MPDYQTNLCTTDAAKLLKSLARQIEANPHDIGARGAALAVATAISSGSGKNVVLFLSEAEKKACIAAERHFTLIG